MRPGRRWWRGVDTRFVVRAPRGPIGVAGLGLVLVAALAVAIGPGGLLTSGSATDAPSTNATAVAVASAGASPTPETGASESATPSPSPAPSPPPTPEPTLGPTPGPTLDWVNVGYAVGIKSPVVRGSKANVTITAPAGPTCTLAVTYPGGAAANEGSPSRPSAGKWVWSWTVPSATPLGTAAVKFSCTYTGLAKPGTGTFKIIAAAPSPTPPPTASPTWSISGTVNSPVPAANGTLTFSGHVNGTPPPGIAPIDLNCHLFVTIGGVDWDIASDGSVQTVNFSLAGPIGYPSPGTYHWHVTCAATENAGSRSTSGTFEAQ